jgi:hypothetical protein
MGDVREKQGKIEHVAIAFFAINQELIAVIPVSVVGMLVC